MCAFMDCWSLFCFSWLTFCCCLFFFFKRPAPTEIYTLSLHDALPICKRAGEARHDRDVLMWIRPAPARHWVGGEGEHEDRKSTRLNSSHLGISYAVFCLKKKKNRKNTIETDEMKKRTQQP